MEKEFNYNAYLLVDSSSILSEQYHGMKNSKNKYTISLNGSEIPLSAIYGYFNFLMKMEDEFNVPKENIIHILDPNGGSKYRKEIYPEYKANRKEKEQDFAIQKDLLGAFLLAKGYKFLQIDGIESDDVIGTLSKRLSGQQKDVLIYSKDKDLLQLLDDNTFLTRWEKTKEGTKVFSLYSQNYVKKEYGFMPDTIADLLAITGDASDNIPGVHKVGVVSAKKLLLEYLNVEGILFNLDKIPEKTRKLIEASKDNLILSKKLTVILKDLKEVPEINEIESDLVDGGMKERLLQILNDLGID